LDRFEVQGIPDMFNFILKVAFTMNFLKSVPISVRFSPGLLQEPGEQSHHN
jgi:hypothetical protein